MITSRSITASADSNTKALLQRRFGAGEIAPVIDPHYLFFGNHDMANLLAISHSKLDNVCQVIFAFGIVVSDARQPVKQGRCPNRHDAAITQGNPALLFACILVFHDTGNSIATIRYKSAIAFRVSRVEPGYSDGRTAGNAVCKGCQAGRRDKRCVGKHDDGDTVFAPNSIARCRYGVAGAVLFTLDRKWGPVEPGLDILAARRQHRDNPACAGRLRHVNRPGQHGTSTNLMKRLCQC